MYFHKENLKHNSFLVLWICFEKIKFIGGYISMSSHKFGNITILNELDFLLLAFWFWTYSILFKKEEQDRIGSKQKKLYEYEKKNFVAELSGKEKIFFSPFFLWKKDLSSQKKKSSKTQKFLVVIFNCFTNISTS